MTKAKKPVRRGVAVNHRAPKKAAKRKPIPSQVADGALIQVRKGHANGKSEHQRHNPRAVAFTREHPTVEEQFERGHHELRQLHEAGIIDVPFLPKLSVRKRVRNAVNRWRSAITGLFVSRKTAEANPDTTVRETVRP